MVTTCENRENKNNKRKQMHIYQLTINVSVSGMDTACSRASPGFVPSHDQNIAKR